MLETVFVAVGTVLFAALLAVTLIKIVNIWVRRDEKTKS